MNEEEEVNSIDELIKIAEGARDAIKDCIKILDEKMEEQCAADYQKFLTVGDGVTLVRFKGNGETKLVARRKGTSGNPNTIFEIDVNHASRIATVMRDKRVLFEVNGCSSNYAMVEKMAISALHRWFESQRKGRRQRKRLRAAKLAAACEAKEVAA